MMTFLQNIIRKFFGERVVWAIWYLRHPAQFDIVPWVSSFKKDGLSTSHNCDSLREKKFQDAYKLAQATGSFEGAWGKVDPEYRAYIVCWAAYKCKDLEGDFVECGVNKGGMAMAAMSYIDFIERTDKTFYLLDTFTGTPEHCLAPDETNRNIYPESIEEVRRNFKDFPNVRIVQGEVPATLQQVISKKIAYLSLDMNCTGPEIAAAEFFWEKMSSGAVMVLDDYNNIGHEPQKRAFDAFAKTRGLLVLSLPTGQGILFKP